MKATKIYWRELEQLEDTPDFRARSSREFPEYLPINGGNEGGPSRRDFLKMMGFSMAAVSLAACEAPVRKAIPYINKPVDVDPGVPNYYASSYHVGNDYCSVVVKTREGRPIKVEGNLLSKVSKGGTTPQVEASVLSLYDEQRLKNPKIDGEDAEWEEVDRRIISELTANTNKTVIVSYSNFSPSTRRTVDALNKAYNNVEWIQYDPLSMSGTLDAYQIATGKRELPLFDFSKAKTIVSFGADFLGNWPNHVMVKRQFADTRKLEDHKKDMTRLYTFESNLSLTGSNADYRIPIKPSQQIAYIANLYNLLAQKAGVNLIKAPKIENAKILEKVANDLWNSRQQSLVLAEVNDKDVQQLIILINDMLGVYGTTIDLNRSVHTRRGNDQALVSFVNQLKLGEIGAVIFYNCNPIYDHPMGEQIRTALKKVKTTIATNDREDETASNVRYLTPDSHYLESWNDFEPITGHLSLCQPTISTIFNTRQAQESFLKWANTEDSYYDFIRTGWEALSDGIFDVFWNQCLHNGVFEKEVQPQNQTLSIDMPSVAENVISKYHTPLSSEIELALYTNYSVGDGTQSNNPWLQEMPDPITKVCWDNYLTVSPKYARENGLTYDAEKMYAQVVTLNVNGRQVKAPVIPQPGQAEGTVGLALGYGRTRAGKVADGVGVNAYLFMYMANASLYSAVISGVSLSSSEGQRQVAQMQTSQTYAGRKTIIQETTLKDYRKDPQAGRHFPKISTASGEKKKPYAVSLWSGHEYPNHHWGMIVDLNSCIGCGTCTVACQAENNIPVVGKQEVVNRREMHWIRIDRYYGSSEQEVEKAAENPEVTFQPMMCQQCNNAPCETVCPVAATTHSTEGLNQMAYNRCIGTRYCANNCPYKVRRFNWFKYHDNDQFDKNTSMNNDLGKMVLNPDVTVRARGVMEKCTFCVQRIQAGKLEAKKEGRRPIDGEITIACANACPAESLIFGDMKDPNSKISKKLKIQDKEKGVEAQEPRAYHVLEELNVMPNVWYLTKVRNKDEEL